MSDTKASAAAKVPAEKKEAATKKEPAAKKETATKAEGKLTCYKGTIKVGDTIYRRGDKVTKTQVNKLPARLHRWFKSAPLV